jgi:glycine/D-amino acid oxidase-like deaminating enzyme
LYQIGIIGNGISAQIAALAAASARCQVTLFEVGTVPAKLAHAHLLLAGSWQALLELAPDLASDLDSRDFADITRDWSFYSAIGKITTRPCRLSTPVLSAEKLLTILKEAVRRRPNIAIQSITAAGMSALLKNPGPNSYFLATGMLTPLTATILTGFTGYFIERRENAKPSV